MPTGSCAYALHRARQRGNEWKERREDAWMQIMPLRCAPMEADIAPVDFALRLRRLSFSGRIFLFPLLCIRENKKEMEQRYGVNFTQFLDRMKLVLLLFQRLFMYACMFIFTALDLLRKYFCFS